MSDSTNSVESVAGALYDIAQGFDTPVDSGAGLARALRLLGGIVPNDRCALLEAAGPGPARLIVEPEAPEEHAALRRLLTRFLTILTNEVRAGTDWPLPDIAHLALWASPLHLAVPLVGRDQVLGVLFVRHRAANAYTNDHLRLLSIVASQIAAHLMRREHEAALASVTLLLHELRALVPNAEAAPLGLLDRALDALRVTRRPSR